MPRCSVTMITRLDHPQRGVALLDYPLSYVNAKTVFETMEAGRADRYHRKSFDYWMGAHSIQERFHSFKKSYKGGKYTNCFTFKDIGAKERFYGFLWHPQSRARYELCVLVRFVQKKEDAQDLTELNRVGEVRNLSDVQAACDDPRLFIRNHEGRGVGRNYD